MGFHLDFVGIQRRKSCGKNRPRNLEEKAGFIAVEASFVRYRGKVGGTYQNGFGAFGDFQKSLPQDISWDRSIEFQGLDPRFPFPGKFSPRSILSRGPGRGNDKVEKSALQLDENESPTKNATFPSSPPRNSGSPQSIRPLGETLWGKTRGSRPEPTRTLTEPFLEIPGVYPRENGGRNDKVGKTALNLHEKDCLTKNRTLSLSFLRKPRIH